MSIWEFLMCIEGWKLANGASDAKNGGAKPPTEDEFEAFVEAFGDL